MRPVVSTPGARPDSGKQVEMERSRKKTAILGGPTLTFGGVLALLGLCSYLL